MAALAISPVFVSVEQPYASKEYGSRVVPLGVTLSGLAAFREEAAAVLDSYTPSMASKFIVRFVRKLIETTVPELDPVSSWLDSLTGLPTTEVPSTASSEPSKAPPLPPASTQKSSIVTAKEGAAAVATAAAAVVASPSTSLEKASEPLTRAKSSRATAMLSAAEADLAASSRLGPAPGATSRAAPPNAAAEADAPQAPASPPPSTPTPLTAPLTPPPVSVPAPLELQSPSAQNSSNEYVAPVVPPPYDAVADRAIARILQLHADAFASNGGTEWKETGVASGVRTYTMGENASRPPGASPDEPFVGARGDSVLPFPLSALHDILLDEKTRYELDAQLDKVFPIEMCGEQSKVDRLAFKGVFPTDPRDFCTFTTWRVMPDGVLVFSGTSVDHPSAPLVKGYVRGKLDVGGWVAQALSEPEYLQACRGLSVKPADGPFRGACRVSYLFRTSIGGTLPRFIVQQVTAQQAKLPLAVKTAMEKRFVKQTPRIKDLFAKPLKNMGVPSASSDSSASASASTESPRAPETTLSPRTNDPAVDSPAAPSTAAAAAAAETATLSGDALARVQYAFNLSGTWQLDLKASTSLEVLLLAMGSPWVVRKLAASMEIQSKVVHTPESLVVTDTSSMGSNTETQTLDWKERTITGSDGKQMTQRTIALAGIDSVDETNFESVIAAFQTQPAPVPASGFTSFGEGSGCIVTFSVLPDGHGSVLDVRHLLTPNQIRLSKTYKNNGSVKARLTQFLNRWDNAKKAAVDAPAKIKSIFPPLASSVASAVVSEVAASAEAPTAPPTVLPPAPSTPSSVPLSSQRSLSPVPVMASLSPSAPSSRSLLPAADSSGALTSPTQAAAGPPLKAGAVIVLKQPGARVRTGDWSFDRWCPDELAPSCALCKSGFSALVRRHHCRECGGAFCDACSTARLPLAHFLPEELRSARLLATDYVRLCSPCSRPCIFSHTISESCGGRVVLTGAHLGSPDIVAAGRVVVTIENPATKAVVKSRRVNMNAATREVTFSLPPGTGSRLVRVEVEGRKSEPFTFTYLPPSISAVSPADTDGGTVEVTGENLGDSVDAASNFEFRLGDAVCEPVRVVVPHTVLLLRLPPGIGDASRNTLSVCLPGSARSSCGVAYAAPEIFAFKLAEFTGGSVLTLYGRNFGASASDAVVIVAGVTCTALEFCVPHAKLRLSLPPAALEALAAARKAGGAATVSVSVSVADISSAVVNVPLA